MSATIAVTVLTNGALLATSQIAGDQFDPVLGNNIATLTTGSGAEADLAVSMVDNPDPVVLGSNLTYYITATNQGPSVATGVLLTFTLDSSLTLVTSSISQGAFSVSGQTLFASVGTMASGASIQASVTAVPNIPGPVTSKVTLQGAQFDSNPANNSASATAQVAYPFVSIVPSGATLTSESFSPPDGTIENGETVTVALRLRNAGNVANTNLQATLLPGMGIAPVAPNTPQTYGVLSPSGLPVGRPFSFTASGTPGAVLTAVLQISDGGVFLTNIGFNFTLPTVFSVTNNGAIAIPVIGAGSPYPSTIPVSGVTGTLARVAVTLLNFGHTYPKDVDVLLVAPSGADSLIMSHAGDNVTMAANLVFDDSSATSLPVYGALSSGTYHPTAYGLAPVFSNPAPAGPYTADLESVYGGNPNGTWSLFVQDDHDGDAGGITNGWILTFTMASPVNPVADVSLSVVGPPSPTTIPANLTYNYSVLNSGPSPASFVVFSNALPAGATLVSASASQGTIGLLNGAVLGNLGSLAVGSSATVTITLSPSSLEVTPGGFTNVASVSATEIDLNPFNNTAATITQLSVPVTDIALTQSLAPVPAVAGYLVTNTLVVTNLGPGLALNVGLSSWLPTNALFVTAIATNGSWQTNGGLFTCEFGNVPVSASVSAFIVLSPLATSVSESGANAPLVSIVSATTASSDVNLTNNSVTNIVVVTTPSPTLQPAGAALISEIGTVNGAIDIGDTVTVALAITNSGTADTSANPYRHTTILGRDYSRRRSEPRLRCHCSWWQRGGQSLYLHGQRGGSRCRPAGERRQHPRHLATAGHSVPRVRAHHHQ